MQHQKAFFFAKNEAFSYNKMQQFTHIDIEVERLQIIQARAGSESPEGDRYTLQENTHTNTLHRDIMS